MPTPLRDFSNQEMINFRNGRIGGIETGAYTSLLSGRSEGTVREADGYTVRIHDPVKHVELRLGGKRSLTSPAANFDRIRTKRLATMQRYFFELQIWLHANPRALSADRLHKWLDALDDQVDEIILAFARGFKDPVLFESGDLANDFRLAKGANAINQIRQLADQDYYEYSPRDVMRLISVIRGQIQELRDTF